MFLYSLLTCLVPVQQALRAAASSQTSTDIYLESRTYLVIGMYFESEYICSLSVPLVTFTKLFKVVNEADRRVQFLLLE